MSSYCSWSLFMPCTWLYTCTQREFLSLAVVYKPNETLTTRKILGRYSNYAVRCTTGNNKKALRSSMSTWTQRIGLYSCVYFVSLCWFACVCLVAALMQKKDTYIWRSKYVFSEIYCIIHLTQWFWKLAQCFLVIRVGRRPCWILIFVNFGNFATFPPWISSPMPNLKCLAQAVQKIWHLNRNPRWRPAAISDFDFCQFWWFRHVRFVDL